MIQTPTGLERRISASLPNSQHQYSKQLAAQDKPSLNQFIVTTMAEMISTLNTKTFFKVSATSSNREKFDRVRAKVGDGLFDCSGAVTVHDELSAARAIPHWT